MDNEKPKYRLGLGHATITRLVDGAIVDQRPLDYKTMTFKSDNPNPDEKPVVMASVTSIPTSFQWTLTGEDAERLLDFLNDQPIAIAKLTTAKGDFYAPVFRDKEGKFSIRINPDEEIAYMLSEMYRQKLERTGKGSE